MATDGTATATATNTTHTTHTTAANAATAIAGAPARSYRTDAVPSRSVRAPHFLRARLDAPARPRRVPRRLVAVALVLTALGASARPAAADAARPGDVSSTVLGVEPADAPISAKVVGGDAFLELTVANGHEVIVFDYDDPPQPYLRFKADGTIEENVNSKAHYQNRARYSADPPENLPTEPSWTRVGQGGRFAWHDHRVHFMARSRPQQTPWTVALTIDGAAASVNGTYGPTSSPSGLPWLAAALAAAIGIGAVARRRLRVGAFVALAAAGLAFPIALALGRLPAAGGLVRTGGLVIAAAIAAIVALVVRARPVGGALLAGAGVALTLWALRRLDVLSHSVLVTTLPEALDRAAVASALGIGIGALVAGIAAVIGTGSGRSTIAPAAAAAAAPAIRERAVGPAAQRVGESAVTEKP